MEGRGSDIFSVLSIYRVPFESSFLLGLIPRGSVLSYSVRPLLQRLDEALIFGI